MAGKAELVDCLAEKCDYLTKKQAAEVLEAVFACVTGSLAAGERVQVPNFGTFVISERAARQGRNPATGETITIAASTSVRFKPGKGLKDAVS